MTVIRQRTILKQPSVESEGLSPAVLNNQQKSVSFPQPVENLQNIEEHPPASIKEKAKAKAHPKPQSQAQKAASLRKEIAAIAMQRTNSRKEQKLAFRVKLFTKASKFAEDF